MDKNRGLGKLCGVLIIASSVLSNMSNNKAYVTECQTKYIIDRFNC